MAAWYICTLEVQCHLNESHIDDVCIIVENAYLLLFRRNGDIKQLTFILHHAALSIAIYAGSRSSHGPLRSDLRATMFTEKDTKAISSHHGLALSCQRQH